MHQKAARWPTLLSIFFFISPKAQKLMKTGCANLCGNAVTNRAAQRIGKDRCSETPTFVIGFSMSQHDRHLVACRLLSHLVHQSHNWEGGDSTSQAWLFLKRKQKIHTLYFISHLLNPSARLIVPRSKICLEVYCSPAQKDLFSTDSWGNSGEEQEQIQNFKQTVADMFLTLKLLQGNTGHFLHIFDHSSKT